jgi:hypothetical protein
MRAVAQPASDAGGLASVTPGATLAPDVAGTGGLQRLEPGSQHLIESARIFRPEEMMLRQGTGDGASLASSPMRVKRRRMQ